MAGGAKLTALTWLGLAIEATQGTPVAPTGWVPVTKYGPQDLPTYVPDKGMRGQPVQTYGMYLGTEHSTYDMSGDFYPGSGGNLLAAIFGSDTVTGTAAPYTHTFGLLGQGVPTYTLTDNYNAGVRQWPGCRMTDLSIKFTPDAGVTYTSKWIGWPSGTYTPSGSQTFGTNPFFLGWQAALELNSAADTKLSSLTLDLTRAGSAPLFSAANSKTPFDSFVGEMVAKWTLEFYMEDDTEYTLALTQAGSGPGVATPVTVTITQPGTNDILTLSSHAVQFTKPTIDRGKAYVLVSLDGEAQYNTTDKGLVTATLANSVSTSYSASAES